MGEAFILVVGFACWVSRVVEEYTNVSLLFKLSRRRNLNSRSQAEEREGNVPMSSNMKAM
jgi:hypothetical protein